QGERKAPSSRPRGFRSGSKRGGPAPDSPRAHGRLPPRGRGPARGFRPPVDRGRTRPGPGGGGLGPLLPPGRPDRTARGALGPRGPRTNTTTVGVAPSSARPAARLLGRP